MQIQPLYPLILCTVRLLKAAQAASGSNGNALSRACILHCTLIVEALANSLLHALGLESALYEDLEQLRTFAKLQLYSRRAGGATFSRGSRTGQLLADLIKLRNDYVHPKVANEEDVEFKENAYFVSPDGKHLALDIPKNPEVWMHRDAERAFRLTMEAVDGYLMDDVRICNRLVERIMLHHVIEPEGKPVLVTVNEKPWELILPQGMVLPRFMARMKSHEPYCNCDGGVGDGCGQQSNSDDSQ